MSKKAEQLSKLNHVVEHIPETLTKYKAEGKKLVGVFPVYAPEELVYAADMIPVGCWGGKIEIAKATKLLPPFACPVMQGITELSLNGAYDLLDGAIISTPCDTLKCLSQNFMETNPGVKAMYCIYPQNNKLAGGVTYILTVLRKIGTQLEELSGVRITEHRLKKSIEVYNENRAVMMQFCELTAQFPGCVTALERHIVFKSRYFMDKKEHTGIVRALNAAIAEEGAVHSAKKKLYLAGIMAEPAEFLKTLDDLGFTVVGDELAYESRQVRNPVPDGIDQYERLALQWRNVEGCSLVYDPTFERGKLIARRAKDAGSDAVIYCQMKFCEVEEFDFPYVRDCLRDVGIPVLNMDIDPLNASQEQAHTRLQAFAEQLA